MTHLDIEMERYEMHGLLRFDISQLPDVRFDWLAKEVGMYGTDKKTWNLPRYLWTKGRTIYIADSSYPTPPVVHLELEGRRCIESLVVERPGYVGDEVCVHLAEDGVKELRTSLGTIRVVYEKEMRKHYV